MALKINQEPSIRQLRVSQLIRGALTELLNSETFFDNKIKAGGITITNVSVSPDLRNVSIYVVPFGGVDKDLMLECLQEKAGKIRHYVANNVNMQYAPQFSFKYDDKFDAADRINQMLATLK